MAKEEQDHLHIVYLTRDEQAEMMRRVMQTFSKMRYYFLFYISSNIMHIHVMFNQ